MVFSWLTSWWNHPSSIAEGVDSLTPKFTADEPLQKEALEEVRKQEIAEHEAWAQEVKQRISEQRKAKQKERAAYQIPKPSRELTIVSGGKCKRCQEIDTDDFGPYAYSGISHHDFKNLARAARHGCELCKFLSASLGEYLEGRSEMQFERSRGLLNFSYRNQKPGYKGVKSVVLEVVTTEDSKFKLDRVFRPIAASPSDNACISLAISWITNCTKSYLKCAQPTEYAVPVRLIDVSEETPFLVRGVPSTSYAILSHCWGRSIHFTTTTQNIEAHEQGIDFAVLPKTFRDAVELTRKLDIRYLWIDSLCILQDSDIDKGHQCARMGDYYRNALVTLSALNSKDSTEGFLNARPPVKSVPLFENKGHTGCFVRPRVKPRADIFKEAILSGRGWTLQERLLSTRVLHFSTTEMFWECLTCSAREGSTVEHRDQEGIRDLATAEGEDFKRIYFSADMDMLDPDFGAFAVWYRLIRQFSLRSLTFADDRLPAVAGLAATMATNTGCQYIAGVWMEDLEGLLWHIEPVLAGEPARVLGTSPRFCAADRGGRVSLIPTWSWASVAGHVAYLPVREERCDVELAASVISVDLKVAATSPYGKVEGGSITLLAVCRKMACFTDARSPDRIWHSSDIELYWLDVGDDHDLSREGYPTAAGFDEFATYARIECTRPDVRDEYLSRKTPSMLPGASKRFMAVMITERQDNRVNNGRDPRSPYYALNIRKAYFLIVEEDEIEHGRWKRVGMGSSDGWNLKDSERREVVLI